MKITTRVGSHDALGESPVWHPEQGCIYWVDIARFRIHRFHLEFSDLRTWQFAEPVTTLSLTTRDDLLLVAIGGRLILWEPETDRRIDFATVESGWPQIRLNDGASGPDGNFWVGSMQNNIAADGTEFPVTEHCGSLYRVTPNGDVSQQDSGFGISNTIVWNPQGTKFYCGCSIQGIVYEYDYHQPTGELGDKRTFIEAKYAGVPDGSSVDSNGIVWNCRHSGKSILGFSPEGELLQQIEMPVTNVTNCVFGDDDLKTLYATSASLEAPKGEALAGNLFAIQMDVPGFPPYRFSV
jgi:sugar lactone lactonase YvrE